MGESLGSGPCRATASGRALRGLQSGLLRATPKKVPRPGGGLDVVSGAVAGAVAAPLPAAAAASALESCCCGSSGPASSVG